MAIVAQPDWKVPRENTMDIPANPHRRPSPAHDHHEQTASTEPSSSSTSVTAPTTASAGSHHLQHQHQHQPPIFTPQQHFPFSVQQQPQGSWTPSISAQPFYPSFYQNQQQTQPQQPQPQPYAAQNPYFDPNMAQWAYQQMMFNSHPAFPRQSPQRQGSTDYFVQNQLVPPFLNGFPSGTPPPPQHASLNRDQQQQSYVGFHPYRRPTRQQSSNQPDSPGEWAPVANPPPTRPYARPDAAGSSSSVNSAGSRQRTDSNQSSKSARHVATAAAGPSSQNSQRPKQPAVSTTTPNSLRSRSGSHTSHGSSPSISSNPPSPVPSAKGPHHRTGSTSSTSTASRVSPSSTSTPSRAPTSSPSPPPTNTSNGATAPQARPIRPSPLSQGTFTASEKRMSRDDIDLAAMLDSTPSASTVRSSGLKGRLRRALSFNSNGVLNEADEDKLGKPRASEDTLPRASTDASRSSGPSGTGPSAARPVPADHHDDDDGESTATVQTKKKSRAASLFSSRMNMSTDNISLSSTVSSASVMIRKLGSMGKLARRNSLAGITSLFKDKKDKDENGEGGKKSKKDKKKNAKGQASEASVSHATAELDRGDWSSSPVDSNGLSPAAQLARQHTLKSNAEAAAKAKAQQEVAEATSRQPASAPGAKSNGIAGSPGGGVPSWERNTATGQGSQSPMKPGVGVNEDGVLVEEDDDQSDDGYHVGGSGQQQQHQQRLGSDGWGDADDDDDWDGEGDLTIRQALDDTHLEDGDEGSEGEGWTIAHRSIDKDRVPRKGILKKQPQATVGGSDDTGPNLRVRSNSYENHSGVSELGPLARIPSPDPDHIDGLHRHNSHSSHHSSTNASAPTLPPLSFESDSSPDHGPSSPLSSKGDTTPTSSSHTLASSRASSATLFSHANSSAPALSMLSADPTPLSLTHRSATAPSKRLSFANNLSVYDTFPATVYDRRSEPATWSRLTPALAQRIKEELNSYKMEEMEVHASSRIHTQFFV